MKALRLKIICCVRGPIGPVLLERESTAGNGTRRGWGSRQKAECVWNSLAVQWLGLRTSTTGDTGSIPGQGTKILKAVRCDKKKKKAECVLVWSGPQNPCFICFLCSSQKEQEGMLFIQV